MLVLPIKKKWFEMIVSGEKKEEYREIKPYYDSRFERYLPKETEPGEYEVQAFDIIFRNGYDYNSPAVKCKCMVDIRKGKEEWGADKRKKVLRIKDT